MNICYYTISINNIQNKANYSYKYTNSQYTNKSDYMMMNI